MVRITETVIRDASQSLIATRMKRSEFEPILEKMDQAGYYSVECWGGATFDTCLRFLNEDPWERLRVIREKMPNTKLQMLLRGQSLLGYRHYPDDVVQKFVEMSIQNGIDIIRIFDAMNDTKNIEVAVEATKRFGGHASCAISYTTSPVHNIPSYVQLAKRMEAIGADSICIKDMAGLITPQNAYDLISALKDSVSCPIILHTHCTTGMANVSYYNAIRAGVDVLDTASTAFSGGTSQPSTEVIARMAAEMGVETGLNLDRLREIDEHFQSVRKAYQTRGEIDYQVSMTNPRILDTQVPGGMYSNLLSQIKANGISDRYDAIMQEIPKVRKDLGYPPLVTPISQMVGTQAIANVLAAERYGTVLSEIRAYFNGEYGTPPGTVNTQVMEKIAGKTRFPTERYSRHLPPVFQQTLEQHPELSVEEVLSLILFPAQTRAFLEKKNRKGNYDFAEVNRSDIGAVVETPVDDEAYALIVAILVHKLHRSANDIKIRRIYMPKEN